MSYAELQLLQDLPWAQRFARSCTSKLPTHLDHEDLQSAGVLGYLRAAERYDVSRGTSFRSFCAVRIRGAVLDELRRWDWAPRSVHKHHRRITHVTSSLIERLEREPTHGELAEALEMDPEELATYQNQARPRQMISFDETNENSFGEENLPLTERLADPLAPAPDAGLLSDEARRLIQRCLQSLPEAQGQVIGLHYLHNIPLRDVAKILKVTPSRVSQLHHQALGKLKQAWTRAQTLAAA